MQTVVFVPVRASLCIFGPEPVDGALVRCRGQDDATILQKIQLLGTHALVKHQASRRPVTRRSSVVGKDLKIASHDPVPVSKTFEKVAPNVVLCQQGGGGVLQNVVMLLVLLRVERNVGIVCVDLPLQTQNVILVRAV